MFQKKSDKSKNPWKEKAKKRRLEIKKFKKRIKELLQSRNHWLSEAGKYKELCKKLEDDLNELKKKQRLLKKR